MNLNNLTRLLDRIKSVGVNMKHCAVRRENISGQNCCLLEHAAFLAIQDGLKDKTTVNLAARWLGLGYGDLLKLGWFASENSVEKVTDAITKYLHARSSVERANR